MGLKIHELPGDPGRRGRRKRIGRGEGSGRGKTAGKGHKGVNARSGSPKGGTFEGGQMPLTRRIPKFGFTNETFRISREAVTLRQLNIFEDGAVIDLDALVKARLVQKHVKQVKLICKGELERKLQLKLHGFSAGAKTAVEARGGSWEIVKR